MNTIYIESERKPAGNGTVEFSIVLHQSNRNEDLVTHIFTPYNEGFHEGHYYKNSDFDAAVKDYRARCAAQKLATNID